MSDAIYVYKSQAIGKSLEYRNFVHYQVSNSARQHSVVKYCWSVHVLLIRTAMCETSKSMTRDHCAPYVIQVYKFDNFYFKSLYRS